MAVATVRRVIGKLRPAPALALFLLATAGCAFEREAPRAIEPGGALEVLDAVVDVSASRPRRFASGAREPRSAEPSSSATPLVLRAGDVRSPGGCRRLGRCRSTGS